MIQSRSVSAVEIIDDPHVHENVHVHAVYDQIASHFSSTRYKPWPIIANFISNLPTGWIGLDSGTGNGKYLSLPIDRPGCVWTIGLDRSRNLLEIARTAGDLGFVREVVWGDILSASWRPGVFDFAISIATIHHLSTQERRKTAVQRLLQAVSPDHGRILIYVWAVKQDEFSKRRIPLEDDTKSIAQDVFVPWVIPNSTLNGSINQPKYNSFGEISTITQQECVLNRYYHMFAPGELLGLVSEAATVLNLRIGPKVQNTGINCERKRGVEIVQNGWERSNYFIELKCWRT